MATLKLDKKLKTGHADRYGVNVAKWLGEDVLTNAIITPPVGSGVTVSDVVWEDGLVSGLFAASSVGTFDIEVEYHAGPRNDCLKLRLTTTAGC
jgi:hypothetical protein